MTNDGTRNARDARKILDKISGTKDPARNAHHALKELGIAIDYLAAASNGMTSWGLDGPLTHDRLRITDEIARLRDIAGWVGASFKLDASDYYDAEAAS